MGCQLLGRIVLAALVAASLTPTTCARVAGRSAAAEASEAADVKKHHHHHHHGKHHHRHHHEKSGADKDAPPKAANATGTPNATKASAATKAPEAPVGLKIQAAAAQDIGVLQVNLPLPPNFAELFAGGVAEATGCKESEVEVLSSKKLKGEDKVAELHFKAPPSVVKAVLDQATDIESKLAKGPLCPLLIAKVDGSEDQCGEPAKDKEPAELSEDASDEEPTAAPAAEEPTAAPVPHAGFDIDTAMPYGDLEPFGREDTAQELTESSIKESNAMVDQLERAEVAEEKRAVFRALTRLRGAAITSFDGIARAQTSVIDEYNKMHQWRAAHPVRHLADEESDISKWAFPDADF